jgi:hypothetical protein
MRTDFGFLKLAKCSRQKAISASRYALRILSQHDSHGDPNKSDKPCLLAAILIDAKPAP